MELIFSKIKQGLRSLAHRTFPALWQAMQTVVDSVTPTHARQLLPPCRIHATRKLKPL